MLTAKDTIAAQATAPGRGGVGIIRISGPDALTIAQQICRTQQSFKPRYAHFKSFFDQENQLIDEGLVLYFPNSGSFTGEPVIELHGHGGTLVMSYLLSTVLAMGARLANPGEFSLRAFLNEKIDLAQAEAIADLIDAASIQAVKSASQSLQGAFSTEIDSLVEQLTQLRIYVEAAIDFPEEEIDFITDGKITQDLQQIMNQLEVVQAQANRGILLKEGMSVVLAGKPNAGKSSLLNALTGTDRAIVTDEAGTTRDILREHIHLDGMPLHIIDTAGLRTADNIVEQEGIKRAWQEMEQADQVLLLVDTHEQPSTSSEAIINTWISDSEAKELLTQLLADKKLTLIRNKIDLVNEKPTENHQGNVATISLSAKSGQGVELLRKHLKALMGFNAVGEGGFIARQRHLEALQKAQRALQAGQLQLQQHGAAELLAEDLRLAQDCLGEITGAVSADDLLGKIFSSFCIGK